MLLIPYQADVPMQRVPWANWLIIVFTIGVFVLEALDPAGSRRYVLQGWGLSGLFSHMFMHADIIHLIGNMVFLWVFGNAVCAKLGNGWFILAYVMLGFTAATAHLVLDGSPAVGASGAINGVVGMFLVLYPVNEITCAWWFWIRGGSVHLSSMYLIVFWLIFDIWGALSGSGGIAYFAHLGGFAGGFFLAIALLKAGWIIMDEDEYSLLQYWADRCAAA